MNLEKILTDSSRPGSRSSSISSVSSLSRITVASRGLEFTNLGEIVKYVLTECSICVIKESRIEEIKNSILYSKYDDSSKRGCKQIRTSPLSDYFANINSGDDLRKRYIIPKIIKIFQDKGLLTQKGTIYYLLKTNIRLTWNNIKQLRSKHLFTLNPGVVDEIMGIFNSESVKFSLLVLVKSLFWYFRKAIVDSILSDIVNHYKSNNPGIEINAISVGSTKLSSDYDISLDTSYNIGASIIKRFIKIVDMFFKDDSENIFDTNVYGVSFTKRETDKSFNKGHVCDSEKIYYIPDDYRIEVSQMIWGYIKLLLKLSVILKQDDKVYDKLYSYLDDKMQGNILFQKALGFVNTYKSNIENYGKIVSQYNNYMVKNHGLDDNYLVSNFISFVNYNGSETYLTNGAFMDVVINQQLCSKDDRIKISRSYMYFTSFVENVSDLLTHYHKSKYTERCDNSLRELDNLFRNNNKLSKEFLREWGDIYSDTIELLKWLKVTQRKCDEDVYKCQVFDLMYTCIYIIVRVSDVYYKYSILDYNKDNLERDAAVFESIIFPNIEDDIEFNFSGESPIKVV